MASARRTVREGLVVGLAAYAAVAVFYSVIDLLAARGALFTVDLLGKAVFRGLRDPGVLLFPQPLDPGAIFMYNALHLVLSLAIGVVVTALAMRADERPAERARLFAAIVAGGVLTVLVVGQLTESMRPVLPYWSIVVANVLASLVGATYLLSRHPGLWPRWTRGVGTPAASARR